MKRAILFIIFIAVFGNNIFAQKYKYVEASELTLIGKIMETENPYHRVDTSIHKGFTPRENFQLRCSSGIAVLFTTNSPFIAVKSTIGEYQKGVMNSDLSRRGFDLYIRKNGKWTYAGSKVNAEPNDGKTLVLVKDMDTTRKECMIHFPIYSELISVKIGVKATADILPMESPFRHRIAIYGSSFTHGTGVSRPGMTYPMQFIRNTGIQLLNLGCGGNGKMQPQYAEMLSKCNVDAMIFDCFSNPNAKLIEERTLPFIRTIREKHPDIPLIFVCTTYRENRNFNLSIDKSEQEKMNMAATMMKAAQKEFKNIYFINIKSLTGNDHETSVDGTHPSDLGYYRWAKSIEKPILKILKKHNLK